MMKRISCILAILILNLEFNTPAVNATSGGGTLPTVGSIRMIKGDLIVTSANGVIRKVEKDSPIFEEDSFTTGIQSEVSIVTKNQEVVFVRENTTLKIVSVSSNETGSSSNTALSTETGQTLTSLKLARGSIHTLLNHRISGSNSEISIRTPFADIRSTDANQETLVIEKGANAGVYEKVMSGKSQLYTLFGSVDIQPNETGFNKKGSKSTPIKISKSAEMPQASKTESEFVDGLARTNEKTIADSGTEKKNSKSHSSKVGTFEEGAQALAALNTLLGHYEAGDMGAIRKFFNPSMIRFQKTLDEITLETNRCKQMHINLIDTQTQIAPDLAIIHTNWEKRCLLLPNLTALFNSGHSEFLMHRTSQGWNLASISGASVFTPITTPATVSVSTSLTCATFGFLTTPTSEPFTVTVKDPDHVNLKNVTVTATAGSDVESLTLNAVSGQAGTYQLTSYIFSKGTGPSGDNVIEILPSSGTCVSIKLTYLQTSVNSKPQTVSTTLSLSP